MDENISKCSDFNWNRNGNWTSNGMEIVRLINPEIVRQINPEMKCQEKKESADI